MMILSAKEKICIVSAFWGGPNDTLALPISRFGGGHGPVAPPLDPPVSAPSIAATSRASTRFDT